MNDGEIVRGALGSLASGAFGFIAAVAVFRARFTVVEQRLGNLVAQVERDREHDRDMLELMLSAMRADIQRASDGQSQHFLQSDRRQRAVLEIVANLAHKNGMSQRAIGVDALSELITSENDDERP